MDAHVDAGAITTTAVFHDVTALTVAEIPRDDGSSSHVLLAGIGSQLHAFALPSHRPLFTAAAVLPNAARCHGLATAWMPSLSTTWIAAHGDRHVALLSLAGAYTPALPAPVATLPRLPGWSMAVIIAPIGPSYSTAALVTVGLSDNSVEFWRVSGGGGGETGCVRLGRVECADRCLLYSMDLLSPISTDCSDKNDCLVAGGTIFLDVVVWAAATSGDDASATSPVLYRLKGHEGSIHTVRWGPRGATLASGSDDRTLRLWAIPTTLPTQNGEYNASISSISTYATTETALSPKNVLYGHQARLWAAAFTPDEAFIASASEDGTARVWDAASGACLATVKAHRYRGVWHCALRGEGLVTAGADGAVKVWSLWDVLTTRDAARVAAACGDTLNRESGRQWATTVLRCTLPDPETTTVGDLFTPKTSSEEGAQLEESTGEMTEPQRFDSTAEWVRCLALTADASTLFVATNRGLLHAVRLTDEHREEQWTTLYKNPRRRPLASLSLAEGGSGRRLGVCDITGHAVALFQDIDDENKWRCVEWRPYEDAKASAAYFLPGMPSTLAFIAGPAAALTLWDLCGAGDENAVKVADAETEGLGKGALVVSLAAAPVRAAADGDFSSFEPWEGDGKASAADSCSSWLVAAGTATGGVCLWRLELGAASSPGRLYAGASMALLSRVAAVHAETPVRFITLRPGRSGSGSGLELESGGSNGAVATFSVGANGTLRALEERRTDAVLVVVGTTPSSGAAGVPSTVAAPLRHSRLIYGFQTTNFVVWDDVAEQKVCAVHCNSWRRPWAAAVTAADDVVFASEIGAGRIVIYRRCPGYFGALGDGSSLPRCLLPAGHGSEINAVGVLAAPDGGAVVFTAGEEASVRQAVMGSGMNSFRRRSVELVADHVVGTSVKCLALAPLPSRNASEAAPETLLVTGGAKQALMAWVVRPREPTGCHCELVSATATPAAFIRKNVPKGQASRAAEVRYLAVDALVPGKWAPESPKIAFVVAGASSGAVELLALPLDAVARGCTIGQQQASMHWQRVATLRHHSPPVISVAALTVTLSEATKAPGESFVAFSGGTDGAVAVWDLTTCISGFLAAAIEERAAPTVTATDRAANPASNTRVASWEAAIVDPIGIIAGVHQSGVNGLSAAAMGAPGAGAVLSDSHESSAAADVMVVTAGDDQALAATLLQLTWPQDGRTVEASAPATCTVRAQAKEANAHSSAARDVWTDGTKAFSVGLDQRLRRWALQRGGLATRSASNGALKGAECIKEAELVIEETGCVVTQALEPAAVSVAVESGGAGGDAGGAVRVAVAGRGMQGFTRTRCLHSIATLLFIALLLPAATSQNPVIVIGAGLSGLAAAARIKSKNISVIVLEARTRMGGRAWTVTDPTLPGINIDLGPTWIHGIGTTTYPNPLVTLATQAGVAVSTNTTRYNNGQTYYPNGTAMSATVEAAVDALYDPQFLAHLRTVRQSYSAASTDPGLQVAVNSFIKAKGYTAGSVGMNNLLYALNVNIEHEYAASTSKLALWYDEDLNWGGADKVVLGGYQNLAGFLARGLDVRLGHRVTAINYTGTTGPVTVTAVNSSGATLTFTAARVVVTLPIGVLKAGDVVFAPPLPTANANAIAAMGSGLLNKCVLVFPSAFWGTSLEFFNRLSAAGDGAWQEIFSLAPYGPTTGPTLPILIGFNAATYAETLEAADDATTVAQAMAVIRSIWPTAPNPVKSYVTRWKADPYAKGSYSYTTPAKFYAALHRDIVLPLGNNKVRFAGEHCHAKYPATAHGAYLSGLDVGCSVIKDMGKVC